MKDRVVSRSPFGLLRFLAPVLLCFVATAAVPGGGGREGAQEATVTTVRVTEGGEIFVRIMTAQLEERHYFDNEVTLAKWLQAAGPGGGNESISSVPLKCGCHPNRPPIIITTWHGPGLKNYESADKKQGRKLDRFYELHSRPSPQ